VLAHEWIGTTQVLEMNAWHAFISKTCSDLIHLVRSQANIMQFF